VRERWPELPVHLSVQANTMNHAAVKFWKSVGLSRVILSRELSLDEVEEIRQECPDMELEVFVHGALCMAYSGRCLLSGYFNHRDANQGTCTNACRWKYGMKEGKEDISGDVINMADLNDMMNPQPFTPTASSCGDLPRHPLADKVYLLEEEGRPGEHMPIFEDEHGTYIMNSKDLRAVEHVVRLTEIGIDCLKIEGRTKSHYYAARTAQAYRQAIDDAVEGRGFDDKLLGVLENLANRGYTDGFYKRHHTHEYQSYMVNASKSHQQQFVGEMIDVDHQNGTITIDVKNRFAVGDRLELIMPDGCNREITLDHMEDTRGAAMEVAPGSGYQVKIPVADVHTDKLLVARFLQD